MIWSRDRWNTLSRNGARLTLGAGAAALALALVAPGAVAQQAEPPASQVQPKSSPVAKTQPAAGAPGTDVVGAAPIGSTPGDDAWVKLCMKNEQTQNKEICLINHEGLEPNTGMVLIAAAVRKVEGEEKQQLLVRVPTAYALVMPAGVQLKIDEEQPIQLQYTICFPTSCQVQLELTKELFDSMRKGKQMVVAAMNIQQKTMGFPVPLTGFAKAYDGAPVDSVKYEESRRQLMEMFRKRQADLAAKAAEASTRCDRRGSASRRSASGSGRECLNGGTEEAGSRDALRHRRDCPGFQKAASVSRAAFRFAMGSARSVLLQEAEAEDAVFQILEQLGHLRMAQRLVGGIGHQVLLRHVGDVFGVGVLGEQVIERLILVGSNILGDGAIPLLGIAEGRVDVEDHAAKRIDLVANHLADLEFRAADGTCGDRLSSL